MKPANKWILLAPELFRAPGGIARVSRHYLQVLAGDRGERELAVVALNDVELTEDDLATCLATGAKAFGCARSKLRCAWRLWRETATQTVHVTCTHVALSPLLKMLTWFRPKLSYDVVVHGIEVWRALPRNQLSALAQARLILSVSDYTRSELVARYPQLNPLCHVLPNALDPSFEIPTTDPSLSTVPGRILAVSRLAAHDWEKGIDHLIQALPAVYDRSGEAHLHVVGEGVDKPRLQALANDLPEPERVVFLGKVTDDKLREELAACELFALPSRKEGFGLVYLEAMAAGKPCIVANAGGAPEVINRDSGVVVPYGDIGLLADTVVEALHTDWNPRRVQQRASEFSFPAFTARWRTLTSLRA